MKSGTKAALYGLAGVVLALGLAVSGSYTGWISSSSPNFNPAASTTFSLMLTDPPSVPDGVSSIYITYSTVSLHVNGMGESGWIQTGSGGSVETMGLVNLSRTILTSTVPEGRFDSLRFYISSATITYYGANYTASVADGKMVVPLSGGLQLNSTAPGAAIVDLQPTVIKFDGGQVTEFLLTADAGALQIPSVIVTPQLLHIGYSMRLQKESWFHKFTHQHSPFLSTSGLSLTGSTLSFRLSNPTADPLQIKLAIISPASFVGRNPRQVSLVGAIVFSIAPDGTLKPVPQVKGVNNMLSEYQARLSSSGYTLSPGGSKLFSFAGNLDDILPPPGILAGSPYYLTLVGESTLSSQAVTAE